MVAGGTEVILGVNNDPLFGPAIMFGLGGIFAEVFKDVTFRLAPVTRSEAVEMIREIRAFKVLDGARGRPKADVEALADAVLRLAALAVDLRGEVAELDVNPLFVLPAGGREGGRRPHQAAGQPMARTCSATASASALRARAPVRGRRGDPRGVPSSHDERSAR
jgi:hypothetical protein